MKKPVILLAWELGKNLGHIGRLLKLASLVCEQGFEPIMVLPEGSLYAPQFRVLPHGRLAAPALPRINTKQPVRMESFADILLCFGVGDAALLLTAVNQWMQLLNRVKPAVVILDYAPVAQLATQLLGLPTFQLTNGFDAPPADCPPFDLGMRGPYIQQRNAHKLAQLEAAFAQVGLQITGKPGPTLQAYFQYPFKVYDCIPESDPYGPRSDGLYVGPLAGLKDAAPTCWPQGPASESSCPRLFAYLRNVSQAKDWFDALHALDAHTLCVWPDIPAELLQQRPTAKVRITRQHVDIHQALSQADAVVNYGSTTTVCQTLLAGKPQLMLPVDMEKALVAKAVVRQGAGIVWHSGRENCEQALQRLLAANAQTKVAQVIAAKYSGQQLQCNQSRFIQKLRESIDQHE
jgi:hypothetical protein